MKKLICMILAILMLAGAVVAVSAADGSSFKDVKTTRWSYGAINYAVEKGYMNGIGGGKFDPAGSMTRGMVVTVLYRREGSPAVTFRNDFSDVKAGKYYSDAVIWAKDEGVVNGITETTFEPNGKITREQLATMLNRYAKLEGKEFRPKGNLSAFPDASKTHSYAKDAMIWATDNGLITGVKSGGAVLLDPRGAATREQFAAILMRFDTTDLTLPLEFNEPVFLSSYTEPDYPLVEDADFYVSPDGNDGASGSLSDPFATFDRAVEAVRGVEKTAEKGSVKVAFMAGEYGPVNISLTPEDSGTADCPVIYCKYGDGDVTVNNGVDVEFSEFEPLKEEEKYLFRSNAADSIMRADLSDKVAEGELDSDTLLISGNGLCNVATFPNRYDDGSEQLMKNVGVKVDDSTIEITLKMFINRLELYHTYENIRFSGTFAHTWSHGTLNLASYDPETHYAVFSNADEVTYGISDSHVYGFEACIIGASEELDKDGEYWIDPDARVLYVYQPSGDYGLAIHGSFFDMRGVSFLSFVGLDFKNTTGGVSYIDGHDITFDRCSVIGAGDNLFSVPNAGIYNFKLINSEFGYLAAGIGRLDDSTPREDSGDYTSCGIVIDNNYIHDFAVWQLDAGVRLFQTRGAVVTHNVFERGGRCGVELWGSSCVTIEYNVFDRMMMNSTDGGSIYDNQDVDRRDIIIKHNAIINMPTTSMGEYGVYLDQAQCGVDISSNLFYNGGSCTAMIIGGRDNFYRDNVDIATEEYKGGVTVYPNDDLDRSYGKWVEFFDSVSDPDSPKARIYHERWSDIFDVDINSDDPLDPSSWCAAANTITGNAFFSFKGESGVDTVTHVDPQALPVCTVENNSFYNTSENPLFVNPTLGDYRIRDGVDFPDIEFEKIGRY